ncbi:mannitol dehydrogenase family protein [Brachybacterium hainanense]|uniref:Mannitol dehydrogenase family protein n=1 Tax=Brachybacterium hainanense TaxID=1541174 RepID=A0ABV6R9H1_9MICO
MSRRLVHLGIGAFARAHTLFYTARAGGWDVTVFTGRTPTIAQTLTAQGGEYGLVVRGPAEDAVERISVIDEAFAAEDLLALRRAVADPATSVVTLTITEKGYAAGTDPTTSAPARLAIALRARREAGVEEPIALVSCDNLVGNGEVLRTAVLAALDPETRDWFDAHVDVISTMVDRITPVAGEEEMALASERLGFHDRATVVTEPFSEWVIEDAFRGARPRWESAGAQLVPDVAVHERRKLRLLNGAHTFLAYAGQLAGHEKVDAAVADAAVRRVVDELWAEARSTLDLPADELDAYTAALLERFENSRLADALIRIAADGSVKLAVRILPVIAERGGPAQAPAGVAAVRAWTDWVTDQVRAGHRVADPQGEKIAAAAVLAEDAERVRALVDLLGGPVDAEELSAAVLAAEPVTAG